MYGNHFDLASGNNKIVRNQPRKCLYWALFGAFFDWLQIGYIFADFCSQLSFWLLHQAVELLGYLHLLVGIKVAVGIHRGLDLFVAEGWNPKGFPSPPKADCRRLNQRLRRGT